MSFSARILVVAVAALLLTGSVTIACCGLANDESCAMDSSMDVEESIAGHCANSPSMSTGCDMGQVLSAATGALSAKSSADPTVLGLTLIPAGSADRSAGERTDGGRLVVYQTTALYDLHATLRL